MRTLILQLPLELPQAPTSYLHAWVQADAQTAPLDLQWSRANLLPQTARDTECVVMVPAAALSWHAVDLPKGLHKQAGRLQAALHGLPVCLLDEHGADVARVLDALLRGALDV
mgnify:CR=1 FL=1